MGSKNHITVVAEQRRTPPRCLGCHRRIFYGDRCPPCAKELRQRRRRKPR